MKYRYPNISMISTLFTGTVHSFEVDRVLLLLVARVHLQISEFRCILRTSEYVGQYCTITWCTEVVELANEEERTQRRRHDNNDLK